MMNIVFVYGVKIGFILFVITSYNFMFDDEQLFMNTSYNFIEH